MDKYKAKDFYCEEDFIISAECEECGYYTENEDDYGGFCPECGGHLLNETSHEDYECSICNSPMDMWDDAYRHTEKRNILICKECYKKLKGEETPMSELVYNWFAEKEPDCDNCKHYWGNKGSGVNPDDICYGKGDCRSCRVHEPYAWKFEAK